MQISDFDAVIKQRHALKNSSSAGMRFTRAIVSMPVQLQGGTVAQPPNRPEQHLHHSQTSTPPGIEILPCSCIGCCCSTRGSRATSTTAGSTLRAQPRYIGMKAAYFCVFRLQQLVFALKGSVFRLDETLFLLHDGVFYLDLRSQLHEPQLRLHKLFPDNTRLFHPLNSKRLRFSMRPK
jgi:hypothetical protein